ncbi:hypothetical protein [Planctomicrobium sp. SH664]|uniref:hypothetical protein n=1 Tax=Planctomicrobium sp. SH664 TaxID=3448125 RepID=UPI003F5C733D
MSFTESLTVRILGDSSELRQELTDVADLLEDLQSRLSQTSGLNVGVDENASRLSEVSRPLQALGTQVERLRQQLGGLSQVPISLNVQPALAALQQLMAAAQQTALQLQGLSLAGWGSNRAPSAPDFTATAASIVSEASAPRGYATGGLVSGPTGIDQVSTRLTAGEYVLSREAVAQLGTPFLDTLNSSVHSVSSGSRQDVRDPRVPAPPKLPQPVPQLFVTLPATDPLGIAGPPLRGWPAPDPIPRPGNPPHRQPHLSSALHSPATTNHFGGIEIHVRESADVGSLVDDLRRQGIGLRTRRG